MSLAAPRPGEFVPIRGTHWWGRVELDYSPFHVNVYVVRVGDQRVLVDAGPWTSKARSNWRDMSTAIEQLDIGPITRIIVTHWHNDHFGMAMELGSQWGVPVHLSSADAAAYRGFMDLDQADVRAMTLELLTGHGAPAARVREWLTTGQSHLWDIRAPDDTQRILEIDEHDGMAAPVDGLIDMPGHTDGGIGVRLDGDRLLIVGDQLSSLFAPNIAVTVEQPDANPLPRYLGSIADLGHDYGQGWIAAAGHGELITDIRARAHAIRAYHVDALARILSTLDDGSVTNLPAVMRSLTRKPVDDVWYGFVALRALTYVNVLESTGVIVRRNRGRHVTFDVRERVEPSRVASRLGLDGGDDDSDNRNGNGERIHIE